MLFCSQEVSSKHIKSYEIEGSKAVKKHYLTDVYFEEGRESSFLIHSTNQKNAK